MLTIAVSAPAPTTIRDITEYCDKVLRRQLETIGGVGQVMIVGGQARQINVQLDPLKLRAHKLTVADVARRLGVAEPANAQRLDEGRADTSTRCARWAAWRSMEEMDAIAVANRDGRTITIGDLGRAEDSTEEMQSASLYNDTPCVLLNIRKQSGTNTVEVADAAEGAARRAAGRPMPKDYRVEVVRDQSVFIEAAVDTVEGAPDPRRRPGGGRRVLLPGQRPGDDHRGPVDPHLDHRRLRHRQVHGLHAQQHHAAGPDALGGHRDRRRHRGDGEHLPLHRGEEVLALSRPRWRPPAKSAWP